MLQFFFEILNLEGHLNCITGLRVTANGWILPIGGASAVEGLRSTGLLCLVDIHLLFVFVGCSQGMRCDICNTISFSADCI